MVVYFKMYEQLVYGHIGNPSLPVDHIGRVWVESGNSMMNEINMTYRDVTNVELCAYRIARLRRYVKCKCKTVHNL